jgi:hypothetical protein
MKSGNSDIETVDFERLVTLVKTPLRNKNSQTDESRKKAKISKKTSKSKLEFIRDDDDREIPQEKLLGVLISNQINPTSFFLGDKKKILDSIKTGVSITPNARKHSDPSSNPSYFLSSRREKKLLITQLKDSEYFVGKKVSTNMDRPKRPLLKINTFQDEKATSVRDIVTSLENSSERNVSNYFFSTYDTHIEANKASSPNVVLHKKSSQIYDGSGSIAPFNPIIRRLASKSSFARDRFWSTEDSTEFIEVNKK